MSTLQLTPGPVASEFIKAVATGAGDEILALGPRGEGKTISALIAMALHAKIHEQTGHIIDDEGRKIQLRLPVPWMCVTDTFNNHKEKTLESIRKDFWQGAWRVEDGGHKAIFRTNKDAVVVSLFGIEDNTALDRVRKETACSHYEEVAPTTEGSGIPEEAVDIGITSQRVPTHAAITMLTSNYPDDDHWLWQRFKPIMGVYGKNTHPDDPKKITYQIPLGDNTFITKAQRAKWLERLKDRPDLQDRLLKGKPSVVHKGQAVAIAFIGTGDHVRNIGYNEPMHLSKTRLAIAKNVPFILGQDGGHTPATVGLQEVSGIIRVHFSMCITRGGMKQQYEHNVIPWFRKFAPWVLEDPSDFILGGYDSSMPDDETDTEKVDKNPIDIIQDMLGGEWVAGPVDWDSRKGAMFRTFNHSVGGEVGLQIDPSCDGLLRALRGQWYYPTDRFGSVINDKPKSPNHPHEDYGQAYCYAACRLHPPHDDEKDDDGMKNHKSDYDPLKERN